MENKLVIALVYILLAMISLLLSFFVVFNFMFTDSGGIFERAVTFAITAISYGVVGAIAAYIRPKAWRIIAVLFSLPALVITLLYSFKEMENVWLNLIYFTVAAAFAFLGAYLGSRIRTGRKIS